MKGNAKSKKEKKVFRFLFFPTTDVNNSQRSAVLRTAKLAVAKSAKLSYTFSQHQRTDESLTEN